MSKLLLCPLLCSLALVLPLHAATITVNSLEDNNPSGPGCTLRRALELINTQSLSLDCDADGVLGTDDKIIFSVSGTINITNLRLPVILQNVIIDGGGTITIDGETDGETVGGPKFQVFSVDASQFELRGLKIINGRAEDPDPDTVADGGAINSTGNVKVTDCTFENNFAENTGGAIAATGTIQVFNSTFSGNTALAGGAIASFGGLTVVNSTFSGNSATGALAQDNGGGAIASIGDAATEATVSNSTFVGNTSPNSNLGGSIFLDTTNHISLANNVFVGAARQCAKGILRVLDGAGLPVEPPQFLVPGNILDLGGNLTTVDAETSCNFTHPSSSVFADLGDNDKLGPLASNGGPTPTIALLAASPAIASGLEASCPNSVCPTTDQRGVARPSTGFSSGAFQFIPQLELTCPSTTSLRYGTLYSSPLLATGGYDPYTYSISIGSLPAGLTLAANGTIAGLPASAGQTNFTSRVTGSNPVPIVDTITNVFVESACQITVTKAPLTITASSASMTYGGPSPAIAPTYSPFVNSENASNLSTQPVCTTTAVPLSPALSSQTSSCAGAVSTNYEFTYVSGVVTVNKAPLLISPQAAQMTYGTQPPAITPVYAGFVNGQGPSVLLTPTVCTTTATSTSPAGTATSICQGATAANYQIDQTRLGVVTINKAPTAARIVSHQPNPSLVYKPIDVVVEVTPVGTLPGVLSPTGSVTVRADNGNTCTVTSLTNGMGSCELRIGSVQNSPDVGLSVRYSGDANYLPSSSSPLDARQVVAAAGGCNSTSFGQSVGLWQGLLLLLGVMILLRRQIFRI